MAHNVKKVGLRPLYNMNNSYYIEVQKWGIREWKNYYKLGDNGSMDSSLLSWLSIHFYNSSKKKKKTITIGEKVIPFRLSLSRIFGQFKPLVPIQTLASIHVSPL